jgi:hypothetical protein
MNGGVVQKVKGRRFNGPTQSGRIKGFPRKGCVTLLLLADANTSISARDEITGATYASAINAGYGSLQQPVGGGLGLNGQARLVLSPIDLRDAFTVLFHGAINADGSETANNYFRQIIGIETSDAIGFKVRAVAPFGVANTGTDVLLQLLEWERGSLSPPSGDFIGAGAGAVVHGGNYTFAVRHDGYGILSLVCIKAGATMFELRKTIQPQRMISTNVDAIDTTLAPQFGALDSVNSDGGMAIEICGVWARYLENDELVAADTTAIDLRHARAR